jgi:hypothetical protein
MATIVYLDADDEITSAAARIRQTADDRVALVIPFGSRVATSRINFRLLAREAMANNRRLDIVAPDASARALAASAGIPVFASVGEYESALDAPAEEGPGPVPPIAGTNPPAGAVAGVGFAGLAAAAPAAGDPQGDVERAAELDAVVHRGREVPVVKPRRKGPGKGLVAGLLLLLIALAAAGAAAYLFLPAAEITVTPRILPVGPVAITVRADPAATAVDESGKVIPAQTVHVPVEVSGDFPATGKRTATTPATGGVRWKNCDPSASYTIPKGTLVRTASGVAFGLDEAVFLPVAVISGTGTNVALRCQTSDVAVTAVVPGPSGNVAAGAIRVVPARYNRTLVSVSNPAPTTGGTTQDFTRVSKKDVDAAVKTLDAQLKAQFASELQSPAGVSPGSTVFPETAVLGTPVPTVDPLTLVNQEVDHFTLGLTADGTVTAVDTSPLQAMAEHALAGAVSPGYRLVDRSTQVHAGDGTVRDGVVTFVVQADAKQVRPVDGEVLRQRVLGLSAADARALLEPYGTVVMSLWPGWADSVPAIGQRVTLAVGTPVDATPSAQPAPSVKPASPSLAPASPSRAPTSTPPGVVPSQPVPSA